MIKYDQLTLEAQAEIDCILKNNETAFNMLVDNFNSEGETNLDSNDVVSRLQAQYFALSRNANGLKTANGWSQNEYNEPNEVNLAVPPIFENKFSSFALKEISDSLELNYPLEDDFTSLVQPFEGKNISDSEFDIQMRLLEEKLGVIVKQEDVLTASTYKRSFAKLAIVKIKNAFLKLTRKPVNVTAVYKGKISLSSRVNGYPVSNIEKVTKVYDFIFKVSIAKQAKLEKQATGEKVSKNVQYAARLFADVLMSRINEFNTAENHATLEKCLWLQFANFVNKYNLDAKQLALVTKLGANAVADTCKSLGINKQKIIEKMLKRGFVYTCTPADEVQALLAIKEKDITKYMGETPETTVEGERTGFTPEPITTETPAEPTIMETPVEPVTPTDPIVTETPSETPSDATTETPTTPVAEEPTTSIVETPTEPTPTVITEEPTTAITPTETGITPVEEAEVVVKKSTIEKMVDKAVIKFLSTQGNNIADKIDSGKFKGKKLEIAKAQLRYYNLMLSYYVQASTGREMKVKNNGEYLDTEISKAKAIVKGLLGRRQALVEAVTSGELPRGENQRSSSYINAVCVSATNQNVREHFTKIIKVCIEYCLNQQFKKQSAREEEPEEDIISLLNQAVPQAEDTTTPITDTVVAEETSTAQPTVDPTALHPELTSYIPDFIVLDENGKEQKPYIPNFVFVEDGNDKGVNK